MVGQYLNNSVLHKMKECPKLRHVSQLSKNKLNSSWNNAYESNKIELIYKEYSTAA